MVEGNLQRIGQVGSFVRLSLGYTDLFAVCTQVGADAQRLNSIDEPDSATDNSPGLSGFRWMSVTLFGEAVEGRFERGISQYPTVGDEVHLVTPGDMEVIYGTQKSLAVIRLGHVAGSPAIDARLNLAAVVSRHAAVLGSTGSGKSNLMAVLLRGLASRDMPSARVLVVDPHGEYRTALEEGSVNELKAGVGTGDSLRIPYWALRFDDLAALAFGYVPDLSREYVREAIRALKVQGMNLLDSTFPSEDVTADTPAPFSLRRLWFELRRVEDATFSQSQGQDEQSELEPLEQGSADGLFASVYPPASPTNTAPYLSKQRKGLGKQLEHLRSRLLDPRFSFLFRDDDDYSPGEDGSVSADIGDLVATWIGGVKPITILNVSALPAEIVPIVVGALLNVTYDVLYWGMLLPVGGKRQPLLVVIDEAHRFAASKEDSLSRAVCRRIAREGRKYGMGLLVVTQRPSDIDPDILSQCGSTIALRVSNAADRAAIASSVSDDLGNLIGMLPSLRTGECLILGEALQVPSRVSVSRAPARPVGDDPDLSKAWMSPRPDTSSYRQAVEAWRSQVLVPTERGER